MADIELVIKVDERDVDLVRKNYKPTGYSFIPLHIQTEFVSAILNGVPVPKGHGRLIDADKVDETIYKNFDGIQCYDGTGYDIYSDSKSYIDDLPTIIEADTGNYNNDGSCNTCEYKHLESECLGCAKYDEHDNLITLSHYKKESEDKEC